MSAQNIVLNVLAQQPSLNLYTQICLIFAIHDAFTEPAIIERLTKGLKRLATAFPWIAGDIINEGAGEGDSGTYKIRRTREIPLVVRDLKDDLTAPNMETLRDKDFPMSMLDEIMLCPRKTMLRNASRSADETLPVFMVQANFISGRLILSLLGHHQAMDMVGQGQVISLLSKVCKNEQCTKQDLENGQLDHENLIPLFGETWKLKSVHKTQLVDPFDLTGPIASPNPPKCIWAYFKIDSTSLNSLKEDVGETLSSLSGYVFNHETGPSPSQQETFPHMNSSGYISTDDILTAFVWQSIARARCRSDRLDSTADSTLGRAVDVRRYLDIPATYPGYMANKVQHKMSLQALTTKPLTHVALELRKAIDPRISTLCHDTRELATILSRTPDKSRPRSYTKRDLGIDVTLSSWRKVDILGQDFGFELGLPKVRRPKFEPLEGTVYYMPRLNGRGGEDIIAICLRDEDMERLREDAKFHRYAHFIG